jgi:hypothetical protein
VSSHYIFSTGKARRSLALKLGSGPRVISPTASGTVDENKQARPDKRTRPQEAIHANLADDFSRYRAASQRAWCRYQATRERLDPAAAQRSHEAWSSATIDAFDSTTIGEVIEALCDQVSDENYRFSFSPF